MIKANTPVVVVAYNRPQSLIRLLESLAGATYPSSNIPLIISIDAHANNQSTLNIAQEFQWEHGDKTVVYQPENLGLRKHILKCGDYSLSYGSVLILEDDLYVSPNFYLYTVAALNFSSTKNYIGGISLYNHQYNVHTYENFSAIEDGFDNWYFQFASSWGQAWNKKQWDGFKSWYLANPLLSEITNIPKYVLDWSDKSWLKFFVAFLIETDKFFLYPKISQSTNFSDAGTHIGNDGTKFQVPLALFKKETFNFSDIKESISVYDAYFENSTLYSNLGLESKNLTIDLFGYKEDWSTKFLLSSKILNYKILKSFSKSLKPIDSNVISNIPGTDIFLYDTSVKADNMKRRDRKREILYDIKGLSYQNATYMAVRLIRDRIALFYKKMTGN